MNPEPFIREMITVQARPLTKQIFLISNIESRILFTHDANAVRSSFYVRRSP